MTLEFRGVAALGAEVSGVDLTVPLSDAAITQIRDGLLRYQVLFFRDQPVSGSQLLGFARRFGELFVHPFMADRYDELLIIENDAERPPRLNRFHQDLTGLAAPPGEHFLHALIMPPQGGDTIWSSLSAAYDALSEPMREFLSGLTATHDCMQNYRPVLEQWGRSKAEVEDFARRMPAQQHPLVRTHPVTGRKAVYVNPIFTVKVDGLTQGESDLLLRYLYEHIGRPEFCVRLKWRVNTLAVWDNRCTSHYAVADYYPEHRRMQRATTCGERPV